MRRHDEIAGVGRLSHRVVGAFFDGFPPLRATLEDVADMGHTATPLAVAFAPYKQRFLDEAVVGAEHRDLLHEARQAHGVGHA